MIGRILAIAHNTLVESLRQRVLNVVIVFGLLVLGAANYFSQFEFSSGQEFIFVKDFCLGGMAVTGVIVAILSVAQMIPGEIETRTVLTLLSKPVHRWEFLVGKYIGAAVLLLLVVLASSAVFAGMLRYTEHDQLKRLDREYAAAQKAPTEAQAPMVAEKEAYAAVVREQARDPRVVQAIVVLYAKLLVVAAIALLVSSFATSMIFTSVVTGLIYLIGHLIGPAREGALGHGVAETGRIGLISMVAFLVPDFSAYNLVDAIVEGQQLAWASIWPVLGYSAGYIAVVLLASCAIFSSREL
jgi:ABC-type Na+ efflux pump permease subunit